PVEDRSEAEQRGGDLTLHIRDDQFFDIRLDFLVALRGPLSVSGGFQALQGAVEFRRIDDRARVKDGRARDQFARRQESVNIEWPEALDEFVVGEADPEDRFPRIRRQLQRAAFDVEGLGERVDLVVFPLRFGQIEEGFERRVQPAEEDYLALLGAGFGEGFALRDGLRASVGSSGGQHVGYRFARR